MPTVSILTYFSNDNEVYNQNIIFTKIVITNFKKKYENYECSLAKSRL